VLQDICDARARGKRYDANGNFSLRGVHRAIEDKTEQAIIVYKAESRGLGTPLTTVLVNAWRSEQVPPLPPLSYSAVENFVTLSPILIKQRRQTKKSGKTDAESTWCKARKAQAEQMKRQLAMGEEEDSNIEAEKGTAEGAESQGEAPAPDQEEPMPCLRLHEVVIWDEHHRKQVIGCVSKYEVRVALDKDNNPALPEDGGVFPERKPTTEVKYFKDARACFGVAMRKKGESFEGVKCEPFSYTGKRIVGIPEFRKACKAELQRVKELGGWQWKGENYGYEERYKDKPDINGKPAWEHELHEALKRSGTICITDVMDHVVTESKKIYEGTPAAARFLIFHDGLSQWWEKEAQAYLHEKHGFRDRQVRAYRDTNRGTRYYRKVVGDTPELCRGLDSHGFADLRRSMLFHVALSSLYPLTVKNADGKDVANPKRFNMGTPAEVEDTMFRCWKLEPTSERIVQDIQALPRVLGKIIEAEGRVVPDEFLRTGRRELSAADKTTLLKHKVRKSQRKSNNAKLPPIHPDCLDALASLKTPVWTVYDNFVELATPIEA
jgi:hypothetical protein